VGYAGCTRVRPPQRLGHCPSRHGRRLLVSVTVSQPPFLGYSGPHFAPLALLQINYRTPLAVGFMVGVGVMMINTMLIICALCGANFARWGVGSTPSSSQAVEAFGILLFMAYVREEEDRV
jgi:hypothetical protein